MELTFKEEIYHPIIDNFVECNVHYFETLSEFKNYMDSQEDASEYRFYAGPYMFKYGTRPLEEDGTPMFCYSCNGEKIFGYVEGSWDELKSIS